MTPHDFVAVLSVEQAAYAFPWSRVNFVDSLAASHVCQTLRDARGRVLGYFVVLPGFEEMHLLNLTVAPGEQGRGRGRFLLEAIVQLCESSAARELWLEVRQSNLRAQQIYERFGFQPRAVRKAYYPAALGRREDAIVMSLKISSASQGADHAP
ncbi:MAG: ribosomal protein S18-alanine N-acetyltransferase [Burkholderiaceae bacterium]